MSFFEFVFVGLEQLRSNKMRSFLTILGILIGVGSVVGIVSLGEGVRRGVVSEIDTMGGSRLIFVAPPQQYVRKDGRWVRRPWEEHLENSDVEMILTECENVRSVIPITGSGARFKYAKATTEGSFLGTNPSYAKSMGWETESGRFLNSKDLKKWRKVCVIGEKIKKELFGDTKAVNKEIKINGERFTVVGVMEPKRMFDDDWGKQALIPITTAQKKMIGNDYIGWLFVHAASGEVAEKVAKDIKRVIKRYHEHGDEFQIQTAESAIKQVNKIIFVMKCVAGGICGISLLVGGIGIMNIMLVSVTERTREIGIRKALGAKGRDIMLQFIVESMVLSVFGGLMGVALGIGLGSGISAVISHLAGEPFPSVVSLQATMLAIGFSASVGVFFGVYPAFRAAKLDPVEALRYE